MMPWTYRDINQHFKLNGISYSREGLMEAAYSFIKEGEDFEREIGDFLMDWLSKSSSITVTTSGSTGIAKQLKVDKARMFNSAMATGKFFGLEEGDSALLCLPANFIAGKMMLVRALVLGLELECVEPSSNPLELAPSFYDFCAMVPMQLSNSFEQVDRVNTLIVGGAPISKKLKEEIQGIKPKIFETFGMTETLSHIAVRKLNGHTDTDKNFFQVLPGVRISVDQRGCLIINAPEITQEPVTTNDLVDLKSETQFHWLGRYDNVVNSGGIKLIPEQIEQKLVSLMDSRFFLAGIKDEKLGERLVLVVEGSVKAKELKAKIKDLNVLGEYEHPREVHCVPKFVESANGKIKRAPTIELIKL